MASSAGSSTRTIPRPPPPGGSFEQHREADVGADLGRRVSGLDRVGAGADRHACTTRAGPRRDFVTAAADDIGTWTDEDETVGRARLGERRLLGQEAVPGMHGIAPSEQSSAHDLPDSKVALRRAGRADVHDAVCQPSGERVLIGIADGDDDLDALVATGADDPNRNLAAVGDEHAA